MLANLTGSSSLRNMNEVFSHAFSEPGEGGKASVADSLSYLRTVFSDAESYQSL